MKVGYSNQVHVRDEFGRFIADIERAATESVKAAIEEGADLSRSLAPSRRRRDPRTVKLKNSISTQMLSRTSGRWLSDARHTLPIELGAAPHDITADVSFYWTKAGRMWFPYGSPEVWDATGGPGNEIIKHPGNTAQPFLRPAYKVISAKLLSIMSRFYPG